MEALLEFVAKMSGLGARLKRATRAAIRAREGYYETEYKRGDKCGPAARRRRADQRRRDLI